MSFRRPRSFLLFALLLVLLALLAFGLTRLFGPRVHTLSVDQGLIRQAVVASGKVRSPQRSELAAQISGQVRAVNVVEGQAVRPGEVLLILDDRELRAAQSQAAAQLAQADLRLQQLRQLVAPLNQESRRQAEATLTQAKQQFQRVETLVAKGFYSPNQLDDARRALTVAESQFAAANLQASSNAQGGSDYRLAESAVVQARAALALADARLAYTTLQAPRAGTILSRLVEPGDSVQLGKVLLTLSPEGDTELVVHIDEKNLRWLALGQNAQVSADAWPDQHFAATINYIGAAVDPLRGSVEVRLVVAQAPTYLKEDMTVSIDIRTGEKPDALRLPLDALRGSAGENWVLVLRDGVAQRQAVTLGLRDAQFCEVSEGLTAGELLIPARESTVLPGDRVRAKR
ncbi:efflux RND transporter periplasmic adaptor subunit [Azonexus sp.]|uniref:efflux RND transporter periplasmic adaptor subunit n=1 Tax=Azonexus sp. TaxID=1872668 RepID=UPI0039E592C0